jgi:hypothetical protein
MVVEEMKYPLGNKVEISCAKYNENMLREIYFVKYNRYTLCDIRLK